MATPLADEPFAWAETKDGRVRISHQGRTVVTLAGKDATRFLNRVAGAEAEAAQLLMARATGQFRFGNERQGKTRGRGQ